MRDYEKTHPWINFHLDASRFPIELWLRLGEARSKCEHIASVPISPDFQKRLHTIHLAKGVHATTAIEGNTLSEEEVLRQLEGKSDLPDSMQYLAKEIENVVEACNLIGEKVLGGESSAVTVSEIMEYNRLVLDNLEVETGVVPGEISTHQVGVTGARYRGAPRGDCAYLLDKLCDWLNNDFPSPEDQIEIWGIMKAITAHLYLAWIHPFGDGNGRTARLVEFRILLSYGVPTPAAHLLTNYYNQTRQEYYRQLALSSQRDSDHPVSFLLYGVSGLVEGLRSTLREITHYQWDVAWRDFVYGEFKGRDKQSDKRKRQLLLDLSDRKEPQPIAKLAHLSPQVAEAYAGLTERTIRNDVDDLEELGLIEKTSKGVRARKEIILAFLPDRKPKPS